VSDLGTVDVALSPEEKFGEFLESRQMKYTTERRIIVDEVFSSHEHFDAEDLVGKLHRRDDGRRVSRSTVYRTLGYLVDAGLLRKMALGNREVYEHDYGYPQHDHMYCQQCGNLIEFTNESLRSLRDEVCREHGFRPVSHRLVIYGTCASCNRSRVSKRRLDMV
jgi:Fur family ferric uptake transcriptional regulator